MPFSVEPPKWIAPYSSYDDKRRIRACRINGLDSTWYAGEDPLGRAWVDAGIAPLIASLNCAGFPTEFCCSALPEDHSDMSQVLAGYIVILVPGKYWPFKLIEPLYVDHAGRDSTVIRSRHYSEGMKAEELRKAWADLERQVGQILLDQVRETVYDIQGNPL